MIFKKKYSVLLVMLVLIASLSACSSSKKISDNSIENMVAIMEVKSPIKGVCDNDKVYAILPLPGNGQIKAKAPLSDEELVQKLNTEVPFLKENSQYIDEGMVRLIVNCKGEMVQCDMDNKTQSPDLDKQIVAIFATMKTWTPASINNRQVDAVALYGFKIKNGQLEL